MTKKLENSSIGQSTKKAHIGPSHGGPSKVYNQKINYKISQNGLLMLKTILKEETANDQIKEKWNTNHITEEKNE